jgi:hypothetical protein
LFLLVSAGCSSGLSIGLSNKSKILESDSRPKKLRPEARHARSEAPVDAVRSTTTAPSFEHASIKIWKKTGDFSLGPRQSAPLDINAGFSTVLAIERYLIGSAYESVRSGSGWSARGTGALSHVTPSKDPDFYKSAAEKLNTYKVNT